MNIAILGPGAIARKMATTIQGMETATAYAVGARSLERAQAFAQEFGFEKAYGSYAELAADPNIDLVYVCTPHIFHYACIKLCLEAGRNVLCEKSFTVNAQQAKELIALARKKNLLLAEAIWTRYLPSRQMIDQVMASSVLGNITSLNATMGYELTFKERILRKELAGGALLDLSVYLLNLARMVFPEDVSKVVSTAVQNEDKVDLMDQIILHYDSGKVASMHATVLSGCNMTASIYGSKGYLEVINVNNPEKLLVYDVDRQLVAEYDVPEQITGFEYELQACMDAIAAGLVECPQMPHSEIVYIMELMDGMRKEWGYEIPEV